LIARHGDRQSGVQGDHATDGGGFAVGIAVAKDDIVDVCAVHPRALQQRGQRGDA
jgi:hypothetical protein